MHSAYLTNVIEYRRLVYCDQLHFQVAYDNACSLCAVC